MYFIYRKSITIYDEIVAIYFYNKLVKVVQCSCLNTKLQKRLVLYDRYQILHLMLNLLFTINRLLRKYLMDIFETLRNEKFFYSLTDINKRKYFQFLTELIEYPKLTPVLYETNVRDMLELYLSNKQYHAKMMILILVMIKMKQQNEKKRSKK